MAEAMISPAWLEKFHVLSMKDNRIAGVWVDKGVSLMITPYTNAREDATLQTARKLVIELRHLGSGVVVFLHTSMKLADPKFFGQIEKLLEELKNE